jgi:hypothetical protein
VCKAAGATLAAFHSEAVYKSVMDFMAKSYKEFFAWTGTQVGLSTAAAAAAAAATSELVAGARASGPAARRCSCHGLLSAAQVLGIEAVTGRLTSRL